MTRQGFSLIELILVIVLAAILGIPTGMLITEQIRLSLRARDASMAISLARMELARLDGLNNFCHADLNAPSSTTIASYAGQPFTLFRNVVCQFGNCASNCLIAPINANNGVKRIDITVARNGTTEVIATVQAYKTEYVLNGP